MERIQGMKIKEVPVGRNLEDIVNQVGEFAPGKKHAFQFVRDDKGQIWVRVYEVEKQKF